MPSAEFVENLNVDGLISLLKEQKFELPQETKEKNQTQKIDGEAFLLLTRQELKDELKLPLGEYLKIEKLIKKLKSQEEGNVSIDEALSGDFDSLDISEISTVTSSGYNASTATLSQMCKNGIIEKDDRLYYRRDFKPSGNPLFTVSQLCRVTNIDESSGNMMVTATKDKMKKKSEAFDNLKALEDWILNLHGIDKNERTDASKKISLIRPLGTLYDLKNN
ncbi:hypothetical protein RhiirA4_403343 [Rhizophagus irregularis]|uniref:SAM domain-containing protein n=1 Tax=Rhizophagus irregularis TaxID=588596 RepID=A0A2I1GL66_9GLOM|nr:hypothetical protein RhiirA4_403343 [Rhizophagus irregularis]